MRFFALLTAGLAAVADAYHRPVGDPKGNPIYTPTLDQQVHKGSPFKITWKPTTEGTVTLVLLRGPSTNVKPLKVIAHKIPNNGHHMWTPGKDLEVDDTHYGLQLIVDKTGQYQYSTQFGIAKPKKHAGNGEGGVIGGSDNEHSISLPSHVSQASGEAPVYTTEVVTDYTTYCPYATTIPVNNMTYTVTAPTTLTITNCPCTITHTGSPSPSYPAGNSTTPSWPTYTPPANSSSTTHQSTYPTTHHTIPSTPTYAPPTTPPTTPAGTQPTTPAPTTTVPNAANTVYGVSLAAGLVGVVAAVIGL